jgi:O-succinylbenzoic acid--CoA ligase
LDTQRLAAALESLVPYKRPKHFLTIAPWPRNAQGKLNRVALLASAVAVLTSLNPGEQGGR